MQRKAGVCTTPTNQWSRSNQHGPAYTGLPSLFILLYAVVQPLFSFRDSIHDYFRPLFYCFEPFTRIILSPDHSLVGRDPETCEVLQKVQYPLLFLPPRGNCIPTVLYVRYSMQRV